MKDFRDSESFGPRNQIRELRTFGSEWGWFTRQCILGRSNGPTRLPVYLIALLIGITLILAGCGGSDDTGPTMADLPHYPGASITESMEQSMLGFMGGKLEQYTTDDDYSAVLGFYNDALSRYNPEVSSFQTELGKQAAIVIQREGGALTVAVQEFEEEGMVNITFMQVGG